MGKSQKPRKKFRGGSGVTDKSYASLFFDKRIYLSSTESLTDEQVNALSDPLFARMTALQMGVIDIDGFIDLNEQVVFAYHLAAIIHKSGDTETREAVGPSAAVFNLAGEAMTRIALRVEKSGNFVASGEDLKALREAAVWLRSLLKVSTKGIATKANIAAKTDVNNTQVRTVMALARAEKQRMTACELD